LNLKGYNTIHSRTEFLDKQWTSSINRLLKKLRDTGTVDRRQGSNRPRSARTDENIDQVNDIFLSQEDQPRTHITVCELDGCIVWNAHNTVLGEQALLIYIVPVCYVKTGRYGKTYSNIIISLHRKNFFIFLIITNIPVIIS